MLLSNSDMMPLMTKDGAKSLATAWSFGLRLNPSTLSPTPGSWALQSYQEACVHVPIFSPNAWFPLKWVLRLGILEPSA